MLRNPSKSMGPRNQSLLNEVLSLNAQELQAGVQYSTHMAILNEVLSLNAQEYSLLCQTDKNVGYPQ